MLTLDRSMVIFEIEAKLVVEAVNNTTEDIMKFGSIIQLCRNSIFSKTLEKSILL